MKPPLTIVAPDEHALEVLGELLGDRAGPASCCAGCRPAARACSAGHRTSTAPGPTGPTKKSTNVAIRATRMTLSGHSRATGDVESHAGLPHGWGGRWWWGARARRPVPPTGVGSAALLVDPDVLEERHAVVRVVDDVRAPSCRRRSCPCPSSTAGPGGRSPSATCRTCPTPDPARRCSGAEMRLISASILGSDRLPQPVPPAFMTVLADGGREDRVAARPVEAPAAGALQHVGRGLRVADQRAALLAGRRPCRGP